MGRLTTHVLDTALGKPADISLRLDGDAVVGTADGDYVCIDGVGSAAAPRVVERSV